jgi:hypothetical protein
MTGTFQEPKYQIDSPDFLCAECKSEVACEARYFSAVFFEAEKFLRKNYCVACWEGKVAPGSGGPQAFAFWRARRPAAPAERPRRARFDPALAFEFFRRIGEDLQAPPAAPAAPAAEAVVGPPGDAVQVESASGPGREEKEEIRFVLALLLVRKKFLAFLSSRDEDGVEWLKLEARAPAPPRPEGVEGEGEAAAAARDPAAGSAPPAVDRIHWVKNPNLADSQLERVKNRVCDLLHIQV